VPGGHGTAQRLQRRVDERVEFGAPLTVQAWNIHREMHVAIAETSERPQSRALPAPGDHRPDGFDEMSCVGETKRHVICDEWSESAQLRDVIT
jgi:hypothetical protein